MRLDRKLSLTALLAAAAVLPAACGGSGAGLIPSGNAGPLRADFEAVAAAAETGNGSCSATQSEIQKTEGDFARLPSSVDSRLRQRLSEGINRLRSQALLACKQPIGGGTTTGTSSPSTTSSPPTSTSTTTSTSTETVETTSSTSSASPNGGTPAEEEGEGSPGGVGPNGEGPPGHVEHGGAAP